MHKSAYEIGRLVIEAYAGSPTARILDLGSLDVNGTLRDHAGPGMDYVGVDMEAGPGVDVVVEPDKPLPFHNASFDLVVATSALEHDPAFWLTFLEMARVVRPGGHIYINVPSNGGFHRYPEDHWRFYPDSGLALERWSKRSRRPVRLVESFVSDQDDVNWNDYCAVFRRLPSREALPKDFLYIRLPCFNVHTWESAGVIRGRGETQDMLLIASAEEAARHARIALKESNTTLEQTRTELRLIESRLAEADLAAEQQRAECDTLSQELAEARHQSHQVESALLQRQEEAEQYRTRLMELEQAASELEQATAELELTRSRLAESEQWVADLARFRTEAQKSIARLEKALAASARREAEQARLAEVRNADLDRLNASSRELAIELEQLRELHRDLEARRRQTESESGERLAELRKLAHLLGQRELELRDSADRATQLAFDIAQRERQLRDNALRAAQLTSELARREGEARDNAARTAHLTSELARRESEARDNAARAEGLAGQVAARDAQLGELRQRVEGETNLRARVEDRLRETQQVVADRAHELQGVRHKLSDTQRLAADKDWLRHVFMALASRPWWWIVLPTKWRRSRELRLLSVSGLFDAEAYLDHYPDVRAEGMDPLRHYIWHGMVEGRLRRFA